MPTRLPSLRTPPIGFAHRGARAHAPDNTIESFRLARRLGAAGLESDVWCTSDGVAVLDHDGLVGGRLRRRPVRSVAAADLPPHIPTLEALFTELGTGFDLSLDVKDPDALGPVMAVARAAGDGVSERLWLCHPSWRRLAEWRGSYPDVRLVDSTRVRAMREGPERRAAELSRTGVDAVNLHASDWSGGLTTLFHRFGVLTFAWDAQLDRVLAAMLDLGMDGVYSDHVDRMVQAVTWATAG